MTIFMENTSIYNTTREFPTPSASGTDTRDSTAYEQEEGCTCSRFRDSEVQPSRLKLERENSIGCIGDKLKDLKLRTQDPLWHAALDDALVALSDVIQTPLMVEDIGCLEPGEEVKMWCCFAEVYVKEKAVLSSQDLAYSMQDKRQVLADILVWAEMTAPGYDQRAAAFITAPHAGDDSFQRIGKFLASAKQAAGLAHACPAP